MPLPPAPLVTSWLLICRLQGLVGFEGFPGLKSMEHCLKYTSILWHSLFLDIVDFISFLSPWMTILAQFGSPWEPFGTIFVIKWNTGELKGTLKGPRIDFKWFLMDFGKPFGHHFGPPFHIFCDLKRQKACLDCRREFDWLLNGKSPDFRCPNLSIYIVNTVVFIRFHIFMFFVKLMILGFHFDLILDTLGGLGRPLWWFSGVLEIPWNFNEFQGLPRDTPSREHPPGGW